MPRPNTFRKEQIGLAAIDLVREEGWEALTARGLGARLGVSVGPVYGAFSSMEELQAWVLEEAVQRLSATGEVDYSEGSFLNRGVGLVVFARDEPKLFLALYRSARSGGVFEHYRSSVRERMTEDVRLARLEAPVLDRIFERLWNYTLGMVFAVLFGNARDNSTLWITTELLETGSALMYTALSGIDRYGSPEARKAWAALIDQGGLPLPKDELTIHINPATGRDNKEKS